MEEYKPTFSKLVNLYDSGKLKCNIDYGQASPRGVFQGLGSIVDAVEVGMLHCHVTPRAYRVRLELDGLFRTNFPFALNPISDPHQISPYLFTT